MLDVTQQQRTSEELLRNLELSGITFATIGADLAFTDDRLRATLSVTAAYHPVDVWQLRDYLEYVVRDAGRNPVPYTVLTESSRRRARIWFHLRRAPRHEFAKP